MNEAKRPWFRFHLLTAVLMMVAASGMLWANLQMRHTAAWFELCRIQDENPTWVGLLSEDALMEYGFPATVYSEGHRVFYTPTLHWPGILENAVVVTALLLAIAVASEHLIRRREGRKP